VSRHGSERAHQSRLNLSSAGGGISIKHVPEMVISRAPKSKEMEAKEVNLHGGNAQAGKQVTSVLGPGEVKNIARNKPRREENGREETTLLTAAFIRGERN